MRLKMKQNSHVKVQSNFTLCVKNIERLYVETYKAMNYELGEFKIFSFLIIRGLIENCIMQGFK